MRGSRDTLAKSPRWCLRFHPVSETAPLLLDVHYVPYLTLLLTST